MGAIHLDCDYASLRMPQFHKKVELTLPENVVFCRGLPHTKAHDDVTGRIATERLCGCTASRDCPRHACADVLFVECRMECIQVL